MNNCHRFGKCDCRIGHMVIWRHGGELNNYASEWKMKTVGGGDNWDEFKSNIHDRENSISLVARKSFMFPEYFKNRRGRRGRMKPDNAA